ncbi:MAG: bacteriocin transport accessory protein [Firmicutes bacterium]|nr:bacteriocin transport accessory protein [Bacillota bacterium]
MKKLLSLLLAAVLACALVGCGSADTNNDNAGIADAKELLTTVWAAHADDEKFATFGGDMDEANMTQDAPGNFGIADAEVLDSMLGYPAAEVGKIDGAASLIHMMNANTFTVGAYHVVNADDVAAVADALKENIANRQWMCGFPDKMVIVTVDDYVVAMFGAAELVDNFNAKLTGAYTAAEVVCDEALL